MDFYYIFSGLIILTSLFAFINARFFKLPSTIGIMMIAMLVSIGLVIFGNVFPNTLEELKTFVSQIDFYTLLMGCMLNFLLFASALHIKFNDLKEQLVSIVTLATLSIVISTFIVGAGLYYITQLFPVIEVTFIQCLVFGALISPTDPIAVMSILKKAGVSKSLETKIAGESLLNDGVAVVLFITLLQMARNEATYDLDIASVSWLLIKEIFGGLITGALLGLSASNAMKRISDYNVYVLITLAVVMGGSFLVSKFHFSGPLAMVAAGLVIGNYGREKYMDALERDYLDKFWSLLDEILNAVLFLLIGLELLIIPLSSFQNYWIIGIISIALVLVARYIAIIIPTKTFPKQMGFNKPTITMLVWGGLRGGVSVALALSIDNDLNKNLFLTITYIIVIFSIFFQGLTVGKLANKLKGHQQNQ